MNNLNTILFDLDGTLLPLDADMFMKIYFDEMGKYFADLIDPKMLVSAVWDSTKITVSNIDHKTNEEIFMSAFEKLIEGDLEIYKNRFNEFYDSTFIKAKAAVFENTVIRKSVDILKKKGYMLAIVTNPLFPYKAILQRVQWAGLDPSDFSLITSYEKNHYCKPQIQFYEEVLKDIGKKSEECMMVGNDVQEDIVAGKIGIKTFLIEEHLLHRGKDEIKADYTGNYEEFYAFVSNLKSLK